jgi:hypothetical protein
MDFINDKLGCVSSGVHDGTWLTITEKVASERVEATSKRGSGEANRRISSDLTVGRSSTFCN